MNVVTGNLDARETEIPCVNLLSNPCFCTGEASFTYGEIYGVVLAVIASMRGYAWPAFQNSADKY